MNCINSECNLYPYYGVAPHICYFRKPGGFNNPLGTSDVLPKSEWPENYVDDEDEPGCGTYYCPSCLKGKPGVSCDGSPKLVNEKACQHCNWYPVHSTTCCGCCEHCAEHDDTHHKEQGLIHFVWWRFSDWCDWKWFYFKSWLKCPECGTRFGKRDDSEHGPF